MSDKLPEIMVITGPLKGKRFEVPASGLRLGRSSSCEIAISDPALSRNHCLIEVREGQLYITDLASANGTAVNGVELGAESVALKVGDEIAAGDSMLRLVGEEKTEPMVDLGLGKAEDVAETEAPEEEIPAKLDVKRLVTWAIAVLSVLGAAYMIMGDGGSAEKPAEKVQPVAEAESPGSGKLISVCFEKVQASGEGIYRFALDYSGGLLKASVDDVPKSSRHMSKEVTLSSEKVARLEALFANDAVYRLERKYIGSPLNPGELKSARLRTVRAGGVFETMVENAQEPEILRDVREQLEAFAKNELGIWGIDKSVDELKTMSRDARKNGDAKWEERDVQNGNLALAIAAYEEAMMLLDTVNPKPEDYSALLERIREAKAELDKRYRDQCFVADKAVNLKDWPTALVELRRLCEMVPDERDPRHAEANAKLLDVEARQKKGGR